MCDELILLILFENMTLETPGENRKTRPNLKTTYIPHNTSRLFFEHKRGSNTNYPYETEPKKNQPLKSKIIEINNFILNHN